MTQTPALPAAAAVSPHRGRGDAWGIGALLLLVATSVLACADPVRPTRDPRCIYVGDTVAVLKVGSQGIVTECIWLTSQVKTCWKDPVPRAPKTCVVGGPMYGRAR